MHFAAFSGFETSANFVEEQKPGRPGKQIRERSLFKGRARGVNLTDTVVVGLSVIDARLSLRDSLLRSFPEDASQYVGGCLYHQYLPTKLGCGVDLRRSFSFHRKSQCCVVKFCGRTKGETLDIDVFLICKLMTVIESWHRASFLPKMRLCFRWMNWLAWHLLCFNRQNYADISMMHLSLCLSGEKSGFALAFLAERAWVPRCGLKRRS